MSLLTEARIVARRAGGTCGVAVLTSRLSEAEQAELIEALESDVSASAITKALELRGHDIGHQTIGRHRRGQCSCPR